MLQQLIVNIMTQILLTVPGLVRWTGSLFIIAILFLTVQQVQVSPTRPENIQSQHLVHLSHQIICHINTIIITIVGN